MALSKIKRSGFSHSSKSYMTDLFFRFSSEDRGNVDWIDNQNNGLKKNKTTNNDNKKIRNIFSTQIPLKFIFLASQIKSINKMVLYQS